MASIIKASINLNEIPKDKIIIGKKGKYLPITITLNDEVDQFGNQGPVIIEQSKEEREAGVYDVLFVGSNDKGDVIKVGVKGDKDPGYGSTSKMIAESAVCLLKNPDAASGGIWTPGAAIGSLLVDRLQSNAGLTFKVED